MPINLDPGIATSEYVTQAYMEEVRGPENIRKWSRKGGTQATTDVAAVDAARTAARIKIEAELRGRYPIPLVNYSADDITLLQWAAERVASYEVYIGRGLQEDDATGNQLKAQHDEAMALIREYGEVGNIKALDADQIDRNATARRAPEIVL